MKAIDTTNTLSPKERQMLSDLKSLVLRFAPGAELFLYGSAARGERGPESDYDTLILLDAPLTKADEEALQDAIYDLELASGAVISTIIHTRNEWLSPLMRAAPFHREVEKEAILI